jgi:hypothetical protein
MMRRRIFAPALCALAAATLAGCGDHEDPIQKKELAIMGTYNWAPTQCSQHPYSAQTIDVDISVDRWQAKSMKKGEEGYYSHNIKRNWPLLFSQHVKQVSFEYDKWSVPWWDLDDRFFVEHKNGYQTNGFIWIPPLHSPIGPFEVKTTNGSAGKHVNLGWITNNQWHGLGFKVDKLHLWCAPPTPVTNSQWIKRNHPHDGVLQDTGDVIYGWTKLPANRSMSVVVWPVEVSAIADFDLFVSSTTSKPSNSNNQWGSKKSISSATGKMIPEMVVIEPVGHDRNIYIAVGSYLGSGQFRLYANVHGKNFPSTVRVVTQFSPTQQQRTTMNNKLRKLVQAVYWGTDGRHLIRKFEIWNNMTDWPTGVTYPYLLFKGRAAANQCIGGADGSIGEYCKLTSYGHISYSATEWCGCEPEINVGCNCTRTSQNAAKNWAAMPALHEFGHCYYGLPDEKFDKPPPNVCGHTIMTYHQHPVRDNNVDFCDHNNGGKNTFYGPDPGHPPYKNNWDCINKNYKPYVAYDHENTPDPFYAVTEIADSDEPFAKFTKLKLMNP